MPKRHSPLQKRIATLAMPDKTVMMLSFVASALFLTYVFFIVLTVYFATMQTSLAASVRTTEGSITSLEKSYYDGVAQVNKSDPHGAGFVTPSDVRYEKAKTSSGLTFAGN